MRYKITRWMRQLRAWFGGNENPEHYLFTLPKALTPEEIWDRMWPHDWGINVASTIYSGEIFTVRKLVTPKHQCHLRFFKDKTVTGHFEVDYVNFPLEHIDGVDLRPLTESERVELWDILAKG